MAGIKELLEKADEGLSTYLEKWNARWANPKVKEDLRRRIKEADTVKSLASLLIELEKNFQYSETPIKPKVQEGEENAEEDVHEEDDEDEDEEEEEEDERQYDDEKEEKRNDEHFYGEDDDYDIKIKKKNRTKREESEGQDERHDMEEEERKSEPEERMEEEEKEKEKEKDNQAGAGSEVPENKEEGDKQVETTTAPVEGEPQEKVKKTAVKIWGRANERIRRCWLAFTRDVDNAVGLFLSVSIFCELVDNYVAKKMEKYFSDFKNVADYMAAKREKKRQNAPVTKSSEKRHQSQHQLDNIKQQRENRRQNYSLTRYAAQTAKFLHEDDDKIQQNRRRGGVSRDSSDAGHRGKNGGGAESGPKRIRKLKDEQLSDRTESEEEDDYPIKLKSDAASRSKKDKLNELIGVRRSTRVTRKPELVEDYTPEEEEEEEEPREKVCTMCETGGDLAICNMCESAYHLDCAGLKSMPDDKWTCFSCLQKLVSQRQTRSTTRKLA